MVYDSGTTEPEAPYGIVTLASSGSEGGPNMGAMRLAQTAGYGVYVLLCFIPGANRLMQWIALQPRCYTTHSLACCHVYSAEVCMIQSIPKQSSGLPCMMHVHTLLDYGRTIQSLALTHIALTLHWKRCRLPNPEIPNAFFAQAGDLEDAWGPATGPCFSGLESQWGCCSIGVSKVRNALLANASVYLRAVHGI